MSLVQVDEPVFERGCLSQRLGSRPFTSSGACGSYSARPARVEGELHV